MAMENPQDVGGLLAKDPFPSTAVSAPDEVDTPLSVALEESEKPKQFWEYQTHAVYTLLLDKRLITAAGVRREMRAEVSATMRLISINPPARAGARANGRPGHRLRWGWH